MHVIASVFSRPGSGQRWLLGASVAFLAFYAAGLVLRPGEDYLRLQSNLIYLIPSLVALALVLPRIGSSERTERLGWAFMAGLLATWFLGDLVYTYYDLVLGREAPFPSLADALYTAGYLSLLVALPLLVYPRRLVGNLRWLLDVLLIVTVVGSFEWVLIIQPILDESGLGTLDSVLALSYPVWDLGLVAVVVGAMLAWHGDLSSRSKVLLVAMAALAVTDSLFSYGIVVHGYENVGNPLELGWLFAYLLIALAATMPANSEPERFDRRLPLFWMAFPYLLALPLPAVVAFRAATGEEVDILSVGGAAVLLMAFLSHVHGSFMTTRALEEERRRARIDSLTGALNHGGIVEEAEALLRLRPNTPLYVCLVDVDSLKHLNDLLGHRTGDEALKTIASRLGSTGGIVGRYGGDEFLVLFEPRSFPPGASLELDVRRALTGAVFTTADLTEVTVSASYGISLYPEDATDLGGLIERADEAMYEEKRSRRRLHKMTVIPAYEPETAGPQVA